METEIESAAVPRSEHLFGRPRGAAWLRRALFGISPDEATFARRGFTPGSPAKQAQLERVGGSFVHGYQASLTCGGLEDLSAALERVPGEYRGFAYEGAGMGLTLLDSVWVGKGRLPAFLDGVAKGYRYMALVGAGWAYARLRKPVPGALLRLDPLLAWLAADGYGFHEGYFHPAKSVVSQTRPRGVQGYAQRAFDQGLGRSLLFSCGGDVRRLVDTVATFDRDRRADLWSGVGLASAYAGALSGDEVSELAQASGGHPGAFAQGIAFAAEAREAGRNPIPATEEAVARVWHLRTSDLAALVQRLRNEVRPDADHDGSTYQAWRALIAEDFCRRRSAK